MTGKCQASIQQIIIIHLVAVLHDSLLNLARVDPRDVILHIASDEEGRVGDDLRPDADVALFDERDGLAHISIHPHTHAQGEYRLNTLHHPIPRHDDAQAPPTKRRHGDIVLHTRQPRPLLAVLLQDAHGPQLLQDLALDLFPEGVPVRVQLRELVRELPQGAAQRVVFLVVERVLEEVAVADGLLAVAAVGFVGVEVDFFEESALL